MPDWNDWASRRFDVLEMARARQISRYIFDADRDIPGATLSSEAYHAAQNDIPKFSLGERVNITTHGNRYPARVVAQHRSFHVDVNRWYIFYDVNCFCGTIQLDESCLEHIKRVYTVNKLGNFPRKKMDTDVKI